MNLFMSWINAVPMLSRHHGAEIVEEFLARLPSMPIRVVLPDEEDHAAAKFKSARTISMPMALPRSRR